jgi:hypothetical protein
MIDRIAAHVMQRHNDGVFLPAVNNAGDVVGHVGAVNYQGEVMELDIRYNGEDLPYTHAHIESVLTEVPVTTPEGEQPTTRMELTSITVTLFTDA